MVDGGSGQLSELDINFRLIHPKGQPLFAEFKKPDGAHTHRSDVSNLYLRIHLFTINYFHKNFNNYESII